MGSTQSVEVDTLEQLTPQLRELGLEGRHPTLVLVGGAERLPRPIQAGLEEVFAEVVVPLAKELAMCVIDGGTDAGVMQLIGRARAAKRATFPLVGVTAVGTVARCDHSAHHGREAPLEPNHTLHILVPGSRWGDESWWLSAVAHVIAGTHPSVTVLANGGSVARKDVAESLAAGRPVLAIEGTGRLADSVDLNLLPFDSGLVQRIPIEGSSLEAALRRELSRSASP